MIQKIKIILSMLFCLFLCSCYQSESKQVCIEINQNYSYTVNSHTVMNSLYVDSENEKFIWKIVLENTDEQIISFNFIFSYYGITLKNSSEFSYTENNGESIEFDDTSYYNLSGSKEIYISYVNANDDIKTVIHSGNYTIECAGITWMNRISVE